MKVISIKNGIAECVWLTDSFNQDNFRINDLVPISQYASIFKDYYRQEIIDKILKWFYKKITAAPFWVVELGNGKPSYQYLNPFVEFWAEK